MGTDIPPLLVTLASIGVLLLVIVGLSFLVAFVATRLSARASGWDALVERYAVDDLPQGTQRTRQTVQFGVVRFKRCVTVCIHQQGLGLWMQTGSAKSRPMLIPWDEVKRVQRVRLYAQDAVQLSIGEPTVATMAVYADLFEEMAAFLPPDRGNDSL